MGIIRQYDDYRSMNIIFGSILSVQLLIQQKYQHINNNVRNTYLIAMMQFAIVFLTHQLRTLSDRYTQKAAHDRFTCKTFQVVLGGREQA